MIPSKRKELKAKNEVCVQVFLLSICFLHCCLSHSRLYLVLFSDLQNIVIFHVFIFLKVIKLSEACSGNLFLFYFLISYTGDNDGSIFRPNQVIEFY